MSHNITSLKLQYYPTDTRICDFFTFLHFEIINKDEENQRKLWTNTPVVIESNQKIKDYEKKMISKGEKGYPDYGTYIFQKDVIENGINHNEFSIDHKSSRYNTTSSYNLVDMRISIFDVFAGEGEWLINYKKYTTHPLSSVKTFGIELSPERASKLKDNKINYVFESAYEDVEIPEESCSLLLFNPPYGNETAKERLTRNYLKDIVNRKILVEQNSFVDFVIREDDFKDCLDILLEHFHIYEDTLFLAPQDEYNKFKQIVFVAKYKKHKPYTMNTKRDIAEKLKKKEEFLNMIPSLSEINVTKVSRYTKSLIKYLTTTRIVEKMQNLNLKNSNLEKISAKKDAAWKWFEGLTNNEDNMKTKITVPKELKKGELVNIMSSGFLNGQIENHIISGGTQQVLEESRTLKQNSKGDLVEQLEVRKINKSFLNVLLPDGSIKSLLNEEEAGE